MGSVATTKSVNMPPTSNPTPEGPSVSEAPEAGIGDAGMMRWRGDAQKTEGPDTITRRAPPSLWLRLWNSLRAGALDLRLKETTRGSDNRCHHVVTIVVTIGATGRLSPSILPLP